MQISENVIITSGHINFGPYVNIILIIKYITFLSSQNLKTKLVGWCNSTPPSVMVLQPQSMAPPLDGNISEFDAEAGRGSKGQITFLKLLLILLMCA